MTLALGLSSPPSAAAVQTSLLPLVAGLAVAEGLEPFLPRPPALKWPNDVVVEGRKLCGILAEGWKSGSPEAVVFLGIGINIAQEAAELPDGADYAATSVMLERRRGPCAPERPERPERAAVLEGVLESLRRYVLTPPADLPDRLSGRCATLGCRVVLRRETGVEVVGKAMALGPDGALHIQTDSGNMIRCLSGRVRPVRSE